MNLMAKSLDFAKTIENLLVQTVARNARLELVNYGDGTCLIEAATSGSLRGRTVALDSGGKFSDGQPMLGLKVRYRMGLNESGSNLHVRDSVLALVLLASKPRPIFRIEFDRLGGLEPGSLPQRNHSRHAAHLHIHAMSTDIGYSRGARHRTALTSVDKLHFPLGGRRFRPSLEDFIDFLQLEAFIDPLDSEQNETLNSSRNRWLSLQLISAVRADRETATLALRN
jgi:hypothetical protein